MSTGSLQELADCTIQFIQWMMELVENSTIDPDFFKNCTGLKVKFLSEIKEVVDCDLSNSIDELLIKYHEILSSNNIVV